MDNDEHDVVSMVDVLQQDNELEEEAAAVLGDSDDKCCTYPMGYVSRQALYACLTCRGTQESLAGICLACSYECHEGHEFVELYTKRNFRCDCGNSKFPNLTCKLIRIKQSVNSENEYNQNFAGAYCTCKRPYPDPDDSIEDEMIQCVVCEDWFHGRHLGLDSIPECDEYQEMVCQTCMLKCDFLWNYSLQSVETIVKREETSADIDVTSTEGESQISSEADRNPPNGIHHAVATDDAASRSCDSVNKDNEVRSEVGVGLDSKKPRDTETSAVPPLSGVSSVAEQMKENDTVIEKSSGSSAIATVAESDGVSSSSDCDRCPEKLSGAFDGPRINTKVDSSVESSSLGNNSTQAEPCSTSATALETVKDEVSVSENSTSPSNTPTLQTPDRQPSASTQRSAAEDAKNLTTEDCRLDHLSSRIIQRNKGAVFWPMGWRTKLCSCPKCKVMYDRLKVSFLTDPADSVAAYEERGKGKRKRSQYDQGMEALSNMDRVHQGEMLHGYHDMKTALSDFLRGFAEQGKVVTASDIQEFYESLQRKRQRVGSASSMQYLCR